MGASLLAQILSKIVKPKQPARALSPERFFFFRLSKTGSTTLTALISKEVTAARTCPKVYQYDVEALRAEELARYRFIHGHIDLDFIEGRFPGIPAFTLIREPKARIISAYSRWRQRVEEKTVELHETAIPAGELSLEEYLACGDAAIRRSVWNFQARLLAGAHWGKDHFQHQQAFGPELSDREIVDRAKATIDRLAFVGLTEQMPETIGRLFEHFGWHAPTEIPRLNATTKKEAVLSSRTQALLEDYTQLDQQIYAHARARFEAQS